MNCYYCGKENEFVENLNDFSTTGENKNIKYISIENGETRTICYKCAILNCVNLSKCCVCEKNYQYNIIVKSCCRECFIKQNDYTSEACLDWDYKPDPIFRKLENEKNPLYMGIELEAADANSYDDIFVLKEYILHNNEFGDDNKYGFNNFWLKPDGSLPNNSCEVVSNPCSLNYHLQNKQWELLLRKMISLGFKSNDVRECGIHIHIDRNYLTTNEIHKLDALVNLYSKYFRRFARRNSSFASYANNKQRTELGNNLSCNGRYSALNFENRHTVEFRIFRGNLKYESVMALFELVQGVCDFVKLPRVSLDLIYNQQEICKQVLKRYLEECNFVFLPSYTEMCRVWRD